MTNTHKTWPLVPSSANAQDQLGPEGRGAKGAKNHWVRKNNKTKLNLATFNVRTLCSNDKLDELEHELESTKMKWDIIGLSETKRKGCNSVLLKSGSLLSHSDRTTDGFQGVGFLIKSNLIHKILEFKAESTRIASLTLKLNKRYKLKIVQVYAPTSSSTEEELEIFYDDLDRALNTTEHFKCVIGDFNA